MSEPLPPVDRFLRDTSLADFTTIGLGGPARYFHSCRDSAALKDTLSFAQNSRIPVYILGGGSNVVFADDGFAGLVLKIDLLSLHTEIRGDDLYMTGGAGLVWDDFVKESVQRGACGIECLSGIPGSLGAAPVQNIGAYGQELSDALESVTVMDRRDLRMQKFSGAECNFAYRGSRFKSIDRDRYVIMEVCLRLSLRAEPAARYEELQHRLEHARSQATKKSPAAGQLAAGQLNAVPGRLERLQEMRDMVLEIRAEKSMLYSARDENSHSCGSFFTNPIISPAEYENFCERLQKSDAGPAPAFEIDDGFKLSAAWLLEHAGFVRGLRRGGVGISSKHSLALININGCALEIFSLARDIQAAVQEKFEISLEAEPDLDPAGHISDFEC